MINVEKIPRLKAWDIIIWKRSILINGGIRILSMSMTPVITCKI